jgi:large subunit ribosomal protein L10
MPRLEKEIMVDELKGSLNEINSFIITGYSGLSSNELNELRRTLRGAGGVLRVVKNCLARIVMEEEPRCRLLECIDGPTAFVLISGDPVTAAKFLAEFAKKHGGIKLRGGLVQSILVNEERINSIARLPNRELLIAQFVNRLTFPIAGFINMINSPIVSLIRSLGKIKEKIGGQNHAEEKGNRQGD